ncbi:CRISPR-associated protein Csm4 [Peptostreptococcus canis]|uniref:CRISPR-associated protein Csm4 n=1 Tax=Peptostreptococcus canis TaxID=1159213 RepID=A0ABR6TLI7_9FIRM|nr:CRISPR-associated protein Csm4 [Peptostreptococcus canis]MBC2576271.1 CRISPR-associated protein Csm4 [Peptostreptococcus canis]MBP1998192.1 CRISPR/Cas system CSM-associated protein Csm4 (group 5 of RAMP superfamily) [Peptostreptococcus canis]
MLIYEFKLKSKGKMTTIPDSQRLFGFLMNNTKKYFENEEISEYTRAVLLKKQKCMVSNLMPDGYYPFPKEYIIHKFSVAKEIYKKIKNFDFIKKEDLVNLIRKNKKLSIDDLNKINFLKTNLEFIQKFRLESQVRNLPGLPNVAYSLPIISLFNGENEQKNFSFFVKIEENSLLQNSIEEMINDIKNGEVISYLGAKSSSGLNIFKVYEIKKMAKKISSENSRAYLNLGMLLPEFSKINSENSFFDLHTSDRKPYDIENNVEKAICFISSGSIISKEDNAIDEFELSKSIHNKYNLLYKDAIIFGNSYLEEMEV